MRIASAVPTGVIANRRRALGSLTTVGWRMLSMSFRSSCSITQLAQWCLSSNRVSSGGGWKKLAEPAQTTLGGQPAWILTYQGKNATGAFVIHQLVSVNAGKGWVVMVFDEPGFETEDQALLRAAVATFHFAR